jgi:hypothetical protein
MSEILTNSDVDEIARQCGEMLNEGTINLIQSEMLSDLITSHRSLITTIESQQQEIDKQKIIHADYRRTALERIAYQEHQIESQKEEIEKLQTRLNAKFVFINNGNEDQRWYQQEQQIAQIESLQKQVKELTISVRQEADAESNPEYADYVVKCAMDRAMKDE